MHVNEFADIYNIKFEHVLVSKLTYYFLHSKMQKDQSVFVIKYVSYFREIPFSKNVTNTLNANGNTNTRMHLQISKLL